MEEFLRAWSPVVAVGLSAVGAFFAYFVRQESKSAIRGTARELHKRLDDQHDRITRLEGAMDTLPTREDFHELSIANAKLSGEMKALLEKIGGMHETLVTTQRSVQRINDFLLQQKAS